MLLCQHSFSQKFFDPSVKKVLFLGNSITYSGEYIQLFETIYRLQNPESKVEFYNCGLPSETVSGLSEEGHANGRFPRPVLFERLDRVLKMIHPDVVIATYGINDGIYQPFSEERFLKFQEGIQKLHQQVEAMGAKIIHVTPSVYEEKKKTRLSITPKSWIAMLNGLLLKKMGDNRYPFPNEKGFGRS
jgi:lysophospholipase L1-like esterase